MLAKDFAGLGKRIRKEKTTIAKEFKFSTDSRGKRREVKETRKFEAFKAKPAPHFKNVTPQKKRAFIPTKAVAPKLSSTNKVRGQADLDYSPIQTFTAIPMPDFSKSPLRKMSSCKKNTVPRSFEFKSEDRASKRKSVTQKSDISPLKPIRIPDFNRPLLEILPSEKTLTKPVELKFHLDSRTARKSDNS